MKTALIGMGSNIEPAYHLRSAAEALRCMFPDTLFSKVYQSAAVGMDGDDFLNACCLIQGVPDRRELLQLLKALEDQHERDRSEGSWKPRTLDLDLLIYGDAVVDDDLYRYAHVFVPASELIGLPLPVDEEQVVREVALCL